jgi:hypothetical protein
VRCAAVFGNEQVEWDRYNVKRSFTVEQCGGLGGLQGCLCGSSALRFCSCRASEQNLQSPVNTSKFNFLVNSKK